MSETMTVAEVAQLLGIERRGVTQLARQGKLTGHKTGNRTAKWLLDRPSVETFAETYTPRRYQQRNGNGAHTPDTPRLTTKEAAAEIGCDPSWVAGLWRKGQLTGVKDRTNGRRGKLLLDADSVARYKAENPHLMSRRQRSKKVEKMRARQAKAAPTQTPPTPAASVGILTRIERALLSMDERVSALDKKIDNLTQALQ